MGVEILYNDIPIGRENAVTKQQLAIKWGINERRVRETIARLRLIDFQDNFVIVSFSDSKGYFKTNNIYEIKHFIAETENRAREIRKPLKRAYEVLKNIILFDDYYDEMVVEMEYCRKDKKKENYED